MDEMTKKNNNKAAVVRIQQVIPNHNYGNLSVRPI